ncbi:HMA2 domain-containing protein [Oxynema aestuarii]|jgi:hypothetical protein|uniref:HMA domain-containing protein n=1 Tax=Oxynema aestuarii AP17 TaxID=2064643 RepID=A0A6H1TY12_9CYAN|nr:hypothetical protein [Oxynema aestuarii]QIZ71106.1 hypothetical protein HCG48_11415 [Oxynema aestuarii AP17]
MNANNSKSISAIAPTVMETKRVIPVQLLSASPGRIRLRVESFYRNRDTLEAIATRLRAGLAVDRLRSNMQTGSLTIFYPSESLSVAEAIVRLEDLGFPCITPPRHPPGDRSQAADEIVDVMTVFNSKVKQMSEGTVDLRFLVPLSFTLLALRQLTLKGWQLDVIPWYVLAWYGFDSFIKLHYSNGGSTLRESD